MFLHCEREELWYRYNLNVATPLTVFPTVTGLAKAEWRHQANKAIVVQGSPSFCRKMVDGLSSIGINEETKIIVTSNEKCRNLNLVLGFYDFLMPSSVELQIQLLLLVIPRLVEFQRIPLS